MSIQTGLDTEPIWFHYVPMNSPVPFSAADIAYATDPDEAAIQQERRAWVVLSEASKQANLITYSEAMQAWLLAVRVVRP